MKNPDYDLIVFGWRSAGYACARTFHEGEKIAVVMVVTNYLNFVSCVVVCRLKL